MPWVPALYARLGGVPADDGRPATGVRGVSWVSSFATTAALWIVLLGSLSLVAARTYNPFIYFRF
jgi:hypothetical protein